MTSLQTTVLVAALFIAQSVFAADSFEETAKRFEWSCTSVGAKKQFFAWIYATDDNPKPRIKIVIESPGGSIRKYDLQGSQIINDQNEAIGTFHMDGLLVGMRWNSGNPITMACALIPKAAPKAAPAVEPQTESGIR